MIDIKKMLTVSSWHITEKTANLLNDVTIADLYNTADIGLSVFRAADYGWIIFLPTATNVDDNGNTVYGYAKRVPNELQRLLQYTADMGCDILCIDGDGPIIPYLPVF